MVGEVACPHCKSMVVPLRTADGKRLCPACRNTGKIAGKSAPQGSGAVPPQVAKPARRRSVPILIALAIVLTLAIAGGAWFVLGNAGKNGAAKTTAPSGNHAPVAAAGSEMAVASGSIVQLDASRSIDVDGDAITYTWRQTSGPYVTLNEATTRTASFTAPNGAGVLIFRLEVSDGKTSSVDEVTLTVQGQGTTGPTISPSFVSGANHQASFSASGHGSPFST